VKLTSFYREKTTMFFTFAFPIILILVFGTIFMSQDNVEYHLCVQDLDQTNSSAQAVKSLELNGKFKITRVDPAINAAQYVRDNKVNLVLVIPKGYERSLVQRMALQDFNASVTITYIYDPSSSSVDTKKDILNAVLAGINQKMSGKPPFIRSAEKSILARKYRFIEFFVPGIIAMSVMTLSLFGTVDSDTELRQKGIIRKLSTTPITRTEWILSNILYQFILAVISTTVMLLVSYAVFDVSLHIDAWLRVCRNRDDTHPLREGGAERRLRYKRHQFPDDVPLRELFPYRVDAGVPAEVRQDTAAVLRERGSSGIHGI
jgi:ABC-2 type transport system permease protein